MPLSSTCISACLPFIEWVSGADRETRYAVKRSVNGLAVPSVSTGDWTWNDAPPYPVTEQAWAAAAICGRLGSRQDARREAGFHSAFDRLVVLGSQVTW